MLEVHDLYVGYYKDLSDPSREYSRKVRTVLRGISGIVRHAEVFSISRYGIFSWQVLSHKVMRWLVPGFLVGLFIASAALAEERWIYLLAFINPPPTITNPGSIRVITLAIAIPIE